jgi:hypothetical protein
MNCEEFRKLHPKYTNYPIPPVVWDTEEGHQWVNHKIECRFCGDWQQQLTVENRGAKVSDYPCVHMAFHATFQCEHHSELWECSEAPILYDKKFDEYSIGPRGGKGDEYLIDCCPWCGVKLPESKRNLWFEKLEEMGIDPNEGDLPEEYNSDLWRKDIKQ